MSWPEDQCSPAPNSTTTSTSWSAMASVGAPSSSSSSTRDWAFRYCGRFMVTAATLPTRSYNTQLRMV